MTARVYTDGCCLYAAQPFGNVGRGPGGYAAIVERQMQGWVVRGNVHNTTSTQMELMAMIEGLRSLPDESVCVLHTDCTVALSVRQRWREKVPVPLRAKDGDLWRQLMAEFDRLDCGIELIRRRDLVIQHRRAHAIAKAEALKVDGADEIARRRRIANEVQAMRRDVAALPSKRKRKRQQKKLRAQASDFRTVASALGHLADCLPGLDGGCVYACPVNGYYIRNVARSGPHGRVSSSPARGPM